MEVEQIDCPKRAILKMPLGVVEGVWLQGVEVVSLEDAHVDLGDLDEVAVAVNKAKSLSQIYTV